jgi:hypothetical protein
MRFLRFLALLLLVGCEPITPRAALRHEAFTRLSTCIKIQDAKQCMLENAKWCRDHELESDCGTDEFYTNKRMNKK